MKKVLPIIFLIICSSAFSFNGWLGIKNEKFTIFYKAENEYGAKTLLKNLNEVSSVAERTTGNKLSRVYFVIDNFGSVVNGFADPLTSDSIHIFSFPPDSNELAMSENWYRTVGIHEYTHMLHMKKCSDTPEVLTFIYGNSFQPNSWAPSWIIEGITTYTESQFSKYSGRLNEGYFDAYLMARLSEGKSVKIANINSSSLDFPYGGHYLYGGLFFRFLSEKYGEKKFGDFFYEYGSLLKSYISPLVPAWGIDSICKSVYGKSFPTLWKEWQQYEKNRSLSFKQDGEKITDFKDYISGTSLYENKLYYVRKYLNNTSPSTSDARYEIWRKDTSTNKDELFFKYSSEIFSNLVFKDGDIYFSVVNYTTGFKNSSQYNFGANKRVLKLNIETKECSEILKDNLRCFTVTPSGDILYTIDKKDKFGSDIYRFSIEQNSSDKIGESNMLIGELAEYNNRLFITAKSDSANFGIFEFNLTDSSFVKIADTPYLEGQISIYDNKLFFVSNYNSQYRSYFYDLISNDIYSLTESGYSNSPVYNKENNTLYYIGITGNGNNLFQKEFLPVKAIFSEFTQPENRNSDFSDLKYTNAGYSENLIALLNPTSKSFLYSSKNGKSYYEVSVSGSDKVMDIPYYSLSLNYDYSLSQKFNFNLNVENSLLLPVRNYFSLDRDSFTTAFSYPLVSNSKPGIESVSLGSLIKSEYDFKVNSIAPTLSLGVRYPSFYAGLNVEMPFENKSFSDTSKDRFGVITSIGARQSFSSSFIQGDIANYYNPDSALTDSSLPNVRGYSTEFKNNDSIFASLNYSLNLLKIRKGIWNPNIYNGDIGVKLFADSAFERTNSKNRQLSGGIELSSFTSIVFGFINLNPTFRVSFPENKPPTYDLSILSNF